MGAGIIDVGLAGGVESMTIYNMMAAVDPSKFSKNIADVPMAMACMVPMGITSENVAEKYGVSKEKQNTLAAVSHAKAIAAQKQGLFDSEIVPVTTKMWTRRARKPRSR